MLALKNFCLLMAVLFLWGVQTPALGDIVPKKNLFRIGDIKVIGIKKVEKEAILEKIGARKGMMLDTRLLKKDLEKIYSLKHFEHS